MVQRYREVAAGFAHAEIPPLETAYWLVKPRSLVCGTWGEAKEAAAWLSERLAEYAPRFTSVWDRESARPIALVNSAVVRLNSGADVSLGFYLERPSFLSIAVVTCSPNRSRPDLACPAK